MLERDSTFTTRTTAPRSNFFVRWLVVVFVFVNLFAPSFAHAQPLDQAAQNLQTVGTEAGLEGATDLYTIIGRIINIALGLVGLVLIGILVYAGFLWMTQGGDPKAIEKAKRMVRDAVIGLVILLGSFAIANYVLSLLADITDSGGGIVSTGVGNIGFPSASGSLGGGIIESHWPPRDAMGVPRNTSIIITFKEPIKLSSLIEGYNDNGTPANLLDDASSTEPNTRVLKIYPTGQADQILTGSQLMVRFTSDRKTFVIRQPNCRADNTAACLGSATEKVGYTVELGTGLQREDGQAAFAGAFSNGYIWRFEVSTVLDLTPPQLTSVIPSSGGRYAPNIVVQMNFNEPVDPTATSGIFKDNTGFTNIEVQATPSGGGSAARPNGEFKIANGYTTVEFVTDLSCGTNTCGRRIYCLPFDSAIAVLIKAATLSSGPPQAEFTASGYDGVVDVAGNSLDGNANNRGEGPATDNYSWNFGTTDRPNLDPPAIKATRPRAGDNASFATAGGSSNIPVDQSPQADFDSVLQASTVTTDSSYIRTNEPAKLADTFWWQPRQSLLDANDQVVTSSLTAIVAGRVGIQHRVYLPSTTTTFPEYNPFLVSDLQNIYQNCFNPASSRSCAGRPNCCDEQSSDQSCPYPAFPFTAP